MWVGLRGLAKCLAYWPPLRIASVMCSRMRSVGVFVCAMACVAGDVWLWQQTQLGQTIAHNVSSVYDVESVNTNFNYEEHKFLILTKKRGLLKHPLK